MVFFSKNTCETVKAEISTVLGIPITHYLGKYLGLPMINGRLTRLTFEAISDRVNRRLVGWKSRNPSMAGRATLVQSTIASMPSYAMQTAKLPWSLCDEIDMKSRRFLWGGSEQTRCIHNISWGQIIKSKREGGLGFRTMRETNATFLTKLGWRLVVEKDKLWSQVLRARYCNGRCDVDMFQPKKDVSNA